MLELLEFRRLFAVSPDATFPAVVALPADGPGTATSAEFVGVLPSGKIVTGGIVDYTADPQFRVARYNADGTLDTTFGGGDGLSPLVGDISSVPPSFAKAAGVLQSDGKIVLATTTDTGFAVARFNADGTVDATFGGGDGFVTIDGLTSAAQGSVMNPRVTVTTDGAIVVIGHRGRVPGPDEAVEFYVARLTSSGTPDANFGTGGTRTITPGLVAADMTKVRAYGVAAVAGGKVVVLVELGDADNFNREPALIQLTPTGTFDTSFSGDGKLPFEFTADANGDEAGDLLVQSDGKIVVVGSDTAHTTITRFNADGTRDTSFGTGGVGSAYTASQREPYDLSLDADGSFVVAISDAITRFTPDGDADVQFAPGGTDQDFNNNAIPIAVDAQSRLLAVSGGELRRYFLTGEDRPDVELASDGTLIITGESGSADNTITVALSGQNVVVTRNGVQSTFAQDLVDHLDILTFDGDDTITVSFEMAAKVELGGGNDEFTSTDGNATVEGGAGNDTISLGNGNHVVFAGGGDDSVTTGGSAFVAGEAGNDTIATGDGNDTVFGGVRVDDLFVHLASGGEEDGQNSLVGGAGDDLLVGAGNRDTLRGGAQADTLLGFAGSDLLAGGGGKDQIAGMGGNDRIYGGAGHDDLSGGNHNDRIFGGDGPDAITDFSGSDVLHGDGGDDGFAAADGFADTVDGGDGDNVIFTADDVDDILNATKQV